MSSSGSGSTSSSGSSSDDEKASGHVSSRKGRNTLNVITKPTKIPGISFVLLVNITLVHFSFSVEFMT